MEFLILFLVVGFLLALVMIPIGIALVPALRRRSADRAAPALQAPAHVLDKRTEIRGGGNSRVWQRFLVTFQLAGGERLELEVPGAESGVLVPGDQGVVHWKGSRYLGFARQTMR